MNSANDGPGTGGSLAGSGVSRETQDRLAALLALVRRWNPVVNLVGRGDLAVLEHRHLADSLRLLPLLPPNLDRAIDLGSGGGFPGLVLAIASGVPFSLIESDQRKAAFLAEAAMQLQAPVRVVPRRIEDAGVDAARVVTARALASLPKLLTLAAPLLSEGGSCLFLKGRDVTIEIDAARLEWEFECTLVPGGTADGGAVLRVGNPVRRTGTPPSRGTPP